MVYKLTMHKKVNFGKNDIKLIKKKGKKLSNLHKKKYKL